MIRILRFLSGLSRVYSLYFIDKFLIMGYNFYTMRCTQDTFL